MAELVDDLLRRGVFDPSLLKRDRKTQKTYDIVLYAVIGYLKDESQRRSVDALLKRVSKNASVKRRKVSAKALENFIEEMITEGDILCEEELDFQNMLVDGTLNTKRWVRINWESPAVKRVLRERADATKDLEEKWF